MRYWPLPLHKFIETGNGNAQNKENERDTKIGYETEFHCWFPQETKIVKLKKWCDGSIKSNTITREEWLHQRNVFEKIK